MRGLVFALLATTALPIQNCIQTIRNQVPGQKACTDLYAYGVSADVTNASTGVPVTHATLPLRDGAYTEVMQNFPTGDYVGAGERAGTYTLTAEANGFVSQTIDNIVVTAGECHVNGVRVDIQLVPAQ